MTRPPDHRIVHHPYIHSHEIYPFGWSTGGVHSRHICSLVYCPMCSTYRNHHRSQVLQLGRTLRFWPRGQEITNREVRSEAANVSLCVFRCPFSPLLHARTHARTHARARAHITSERYLRLVRRKFDIFPFLHTPPYAHPHACTTTESTPPLTRPTTCRMELESP